MAEASILDRVYHFVLETFVERGTAPHYTEIAAAFSRGPEAGRALLHELMATGIPAWLYHDTDYVASFAPFNNLPTQYRVSVGGRQAWFAQCGFEALAIGWHFPGRTVTVDAPCLDCGEPLRIEMRDGVIENAEPAGIFGFVDIPFREWRPNLAYS